MSFISFGRTLELRFKKARKASVSPNSKSTVRFTSGSKVLGEFF
jgi:hypothetical protein